MPQVNVDDKIDWIQFYSERLPTSPRPAGEHKYNACCPFHQEKNPSFWFNTRNGMWKCESGCGSGNATTFLARYESIDNGEAWEKLCSLAGVTPPALCATSSHRGGNAAPDANLPLTLAQYAESKKLPLEFLQQLGLNDHPGNGYAPAHVVIPYYDADRACTAIRQRRNPRNAQRFAWNRGGTVIPYGAWMELNKDAKALLLVEGESDAQSCWLHGLPALGIPGATNYKASWTARYIGNRDLYIHVEPDAGGQSFRKKLLERLNESGFTGRIFAFSCHDIDPECKDPSDIHIKYGDSFREKMDPAIRKAAAVDLTAECIKIHEAKPAAPETKTIKKLQVYHAADLYGKKIEKPPTIVSGMIPAGLTVLAGAPKRGKSWLSLMLAICVAAGDPFLGAQTTQGDVLYLDLESKQYRVQDRLNKLLVGRAPESLYITHESDRLEAGLVEQLAMWCDDVEHPVLIIIDTLGRVKGSARRGENAYEGDTRILGDLQRFALQRNMAVVCVHHLRKSMADGDYFERISGSMGITGACDSVMVMQGKRGDKDSTLAISSRDFESAELVIGFENGRWSLKSLDSEAYREEQAYTNSPYVRAVIALAHRYHRWEGSPTEFVQELAAFDPRSCDVRPEKVTEELKRFAVRLHDTEGVLFRSGRRKKGRFVIVQEVQTDGF